MQELCEIARNQAKERQYVLSYSAVQAIISSLQDRRESAGFGNAREVRNLIEKAIQAQASRLISSNPNIQDISNEEISQLTGEDISSDTDF